MSGDSERTINGRMQFAANCEECRKQLYRFARSKVGNKADAEEIANESIMRFLVSMEGNGWEREIVNPSAYMITIAKNVCIEWQLQCRGETSLDGDDEPGKRNRDDLDRLAAELNNPATRLCKDLMFQKLFKLMPKSVFAKLSEFELRLFWMSAVEEMTPQEIGEELKGCPELLPQNVSAEVATSPDFISRRINSVGTKLRYRVRTLGLKLS